MREELALWIAPPRLDVDADAREQLLVLADDAGGLGLDVGDADRLELRAGVGIESLDDAACRDVGQAREPVGDLRTDLEGQLGRQDAQHEGGHVLDEEPAPAVVHEASRHRDGPRRRQALPCQLLEAGGLGELELEEAQAETGHRQHDGHTERQQAWREAQLPTAARRAADRLAGCRHALTTPSRSGSPKRRSRARTATTVTAAMAALERAMKSRSGNDRPAKATSEVTARSPSSMSW